MKPKPQERLRESRSWPISDGSENERKTARALRVFRSVSFGRPSDRAAGASADFGHTHAMRHPQMMAEPRQYVRQGNRCRENSADEIEAFDRARD